MHQNTLDGMALLAVTGLGGFQLSRDGPLTGLGDNPMEGVEADKERSGGAA